MEVWKGKREYNSSHMRKNWITLIWLADLCRKRRTVILVINLRNLAKLEQTRLICVHVHVLEICNECDPEVNV